MVGFQELTEAQVSKLNIGMQVFIKLTGRGWDDIDKEEDEGLYHVGSDRKLWSEDSDGFFFIYEMNEPNYEYKVYIPSLKYKLNSIMNDVKVLMQVYSLDSEEVIEMIRGKL